ncbi:MAG: response regulator transcription factor [Cyanomargarita calcarea GSE-NOS-MK-12-04C]|jgi:two-component system OmpR family response regulator|uniref:Response regulator transcription factor n=1 Tax=Cyanomargarita calcarea GSE-NOS-MK-12-04C TaxID=2839659 RepID=A0A951QUH8_9CYAN|nr:response regulator transcription factor [Cyanomargarita calcarea GSE-NOS-MK-12-04C]
MKILLAEDDSRIAQLLTEALANQHYLVDIAPDGEKGREFANSFTYDLLILDVTLPKLDGINLCRQMRSQGCRTPIMMLTARDTADDKVTGLDAGADDYMIKPYNLQELLARIRALLRRGDNPFSALMEWGVLRVDPNTCQVTYAEQLLQLTPKEYSLIELLIRAGRRVTSRNQIIDNLWSFEEPPTEDAVKALVKRLRQKLKATGAPDDFITTAYGFGYHLADKS